MNRILLFLIATITIDAVAQQGEGYFKHFTSDDGLPSNYISAIIQDHEGFMWFCTSEGLSRYDGYSFFNFRNSPSDSTSLVNNNVRCIAEDSKHNFWIGTQKGLVYLDLNIYKFKRFSLKFKDDIGTNWITSICLIDDSHLLVSTFTKGFYIFDIATEKLVSYQHEAGNENSLLHNTIRYAIRDRENTFWLATDGGLERFIFKTGKIIHFLKGKSIQQISLNLEDNIVVSTLGDAELYIIDPHSQQLIRTQSLPEIYKDKPKHTYFDSYGNQWLGIVDGGLIYQNEKSKKTTHWVYNKYSPHGINSNAPLVVFEDAIGNIWIGTFDGGVNLLEKHRKPFLQIKSNFLETGLQSNHVRSIFQDKEGDIWIGTKVGGMLSKFNRETLEFIHYKQNVSISGSLNDEFVLSITEAKPGYLWVGTLYGGLNLFDKRTGKFTALKHDPNNPNGLLSNSILALYHDKDDKIWVGHAEKGLDVYDSNKGTFTHYLSSSNINSLSDNRIRVIYQDHNKNIWIGTFNGLNLFNPSTGTFKRFLNNVADKKSISDNNIFSIWEDKNNRLWIGTGNGFNQYIKETRSFVGHNKDNGFPANSARGIYDDNEGNIWISTDHGIVKFDPSTNKFSNYTREDGLNSNEFAFYSSYKTQAGEILFGSDNGFVLFNPEKITDNFITPRIVFTDFKLFNQDVPIGTEGSPLVKHIARTKEMMLTYKQSVVTFNFSALNFTSPEKNQYAFIMEGFDKGWNYVGTQKSATYTNLSAGNYKFRVKASNNDGIWNEQGIALDINILPPPWKTWWAFVIYTILILAAFLQLRDFTVKRIHAEKELEIGEMKLKLFMNISHEFRTPLSLMLNPLDKISKSDDIEEIHTSIQMVKRSSWKLLNLVNQLLDFRKIDQGQFPLKVRKGDIISFTKRINHLFEDLAKTKEIDLMFESPLSKLDVWIDPDKYEKILSNLLSNALKFTNPGGKITVTISQSSLKSRLSILNKLRGAKARKYFELRITDTGIGLKKEDLKNIFEGFYQVDQLKAGTGIGLSYVKSLVELHSGEVLVESELHKGSSFIVLLPLGDEHLKPEQIAQSGSDLTDWEDRFDMAAIESLQYDIENTDYYPDIENENDAVLNPDQAKKIILIVEDNKTLRKQIQAELKDTYIIKEASNGLEGWEKIQKYLPDLVISDIMMPKMNGIELCKKSKDNINTSHIPVLLLTAKSSVENKIEGFETGADEYMPKPFSMQILEVRIKNLIQIRTKLKEKYSMSKVLEPAKEYTTNNVDEAFLEKATQIVVENIENPDFSLAELRDKMGMSRTNLFNKIQAITGQNPSNFVRTIRLKYATKLLMQNSISIKDVCFKCGFNSPAYFIKTFRELYGQTPKEYMDSNLNTNLG